MPAPVPRPPPAIRQMDDGEFTRLPLTGPPRIEPEGEAPLPIPSNGARNTDQPAPSELHPAPGNVGIAPMPHLRPTPPLA